MYKKSVLLLPFFLAIFARPVMLMATLQATLQQHAVAAGLVKDLYGISGDLSGLSSPDLTNQLNGYQNLGAKWTRIDFGWPTIQPSNSKSYSWMQLDFVVTAVNAHGIKILGSLDYTPTWELPSGCTDNSHCPPKSSTDYAKFVAAVVTRYVPKGVHTWEIWNEPNGGTFSPSSYTTMLKAAYTAIKHADPSAFVLSGGSEPAATSGGSYQSVDFLTDMYKNGAKGYFDALAHHPYCWAAAFNCPTAYATWSAWSQMQETNPSLRSVMIANGDGNKQIWATEFGAPTGGDTREVSTPGTESQQVQRLHDAYTLFSSYSWAGPLFWYTYQDRTWCTDPNDPECHFGLLRADGSQKPAYAIYQSLAKQQQTTR